MKKTIFTSLLLVVSVFIGRTQTDFRYEPDTIKVFDIGYDPDEIIPTIMQIYTYSELGLVTTREMRFWDSEENEYSDEYNDRIVYTHNEDNLRESETEMFWDDEANDWENQYKIEYTYSNKLLASVTHSNWNSSTNSFDYGYRELYDYDEQKNITSYKTQNWNENQWEDDYEYNIIYTYDDDFNITSKQEFNVANPSTIYHYLFTYDANGNVLSDTSNIIQEGNEKKYAYNTYSYDNNNNLLQRVTMEWKETENSYLYASWDGRITYTYDNNNRTSHIRETYDYNTSTWKVDGWNPRIDWAYTDNNATLIKAFYFDNNTGQWENGISGHVDLYYNNMNSQFEMEWGGHQFEVSYLAFEEISKVNNDKKSVITVFPNPTTDYLHITGISEPTQITVYDLSGKIIETQMVHGNIGTLRIQNYKAGMYIVNIANSSQQLTRRIVKK